MSMGSLDMVEENVPYLGMDQLTNCGLMRRRLACPTACSGVRRRRLTFDQYRAGIVIIG